MRVARVAAQAKVNLYLRVGPADGSGYHALETVFQRIDLADEVTVRVGGAGRALTVRGPLLPPGGLGPAEDNLAYRAALAYYGATGWPGDFAIELAKHIPTGGGLGGGSADAGAVLRCLDALAPRPLGEAGLLTLAGTLGADVPFLTSGHVRALGTGRGDVLTPATPLPGRPVLLAVPPFGVRTADAYRWLDEDDAGTLIASVLDAPAQGFAVADPWSAMVAGSHNDFEGPVERRHPALRALREKLAGAGAELARLSGSGSTVFGIFRGPPGAHGIAPDEAHVIPTRTSANVVPVEVVE